MSNCNCNCNWLFKFKSNCNCNCNWDFKLKCNCNCNWLFLSTLFSNYITKWHHNGQKTKWKWVHTKWCKHVENFKFVFVLKYFRKSIFKFVFSAQVVYKYFSLYAHNLGVYCNPLPPLVRWSVHQIFSALYRPQF